MTTFILRVPSKDAAALMGRATRVRPFRKGSKAEEVIRLMERKSGVTVSDLAEKQGVTEKAARAYLTTYPRRVGRDYERDAKGRYHLV